jgi:hypothetical protein
MCEALGSMLNTANKQIKNPKHSIHMVHPTFVKTKNVKNKALEVLEENLTEYFYSLL